MYLIPFSLTPYRYEMKFEIWYGIYLFALCNISDTKFPTIMKTENTNPLVALSKRNYVKLFCYSIFHTGWTCSWFTKAIKKLNAIFWYIQHLRDPKMNKCYNQWMTFFIHYYQKIQQLMIVTKISIPALNVSIICRRNYLYYSS